MQQELDLKQDKQDQELSDKKSQDSFYQKLSDGFEVNILIVGDSIGEGSGTETDGKQWFDQLGNYLRKEYSCNVKVTNISMGGNTSYAGYVRTMALDDNVDYDLAIICYGQNDAEDGFSLNYEAMVRALETKYPDCSLISVLESSQREYTNKMTEIQKICEHYSISVADTIAAFKESDKDYSELTNDGVHPNDAGQDIYFNTIKDVIDKNVAVSTGKPTLADAINADVEKFDNFVWYDAEKDFERVDDVTFTLSVNVSGMMGIDYTYETGDNKADIYVDGILYESPTVTFDYDFSQRHILVVNDNCKVNKEIKIVFSNKEQADGFKGICFNW